MQNHVNYMKHRDAMHSALNLKLFEQGLSPSVIHAWHLFPNLVAKPYLPNHCTNKTQLNATPLVQL